MKTNNLSLKIFTGLALALVLVFIATFKAEAAEITGTITTGMGSGVVAAEPTASPVSGTNFSSTRTVTLSAPESNSIRYTTNGTTPDCSPVVGTLYAGTFTLSSTTTVKAVACYDEDAQSDVASFTYTKNSSSGGGGSSGTSVSKPVASPVAGTYTVAKSVVLTSSGSTSIRYTTDGTTPSCSVGTVYSSAISVASSKTIKAIGCKTGSTASSVATFAYVINLATNTPNTPAAPSTPAANNNNASSNNSCSAFSRTLKVGVNGEDVKLLQGFLGLTADGGFGPKTALGVKAFQAANGLLPADGIVGPMTLAKIKALHCGQTTVVNPPVVPTAGKYMFNVNLQVGSIGEDARQLQIYLNANGSVVATSGAGSPGNETLKFGGATKAALVKYQAANGISPASGFFGPMTRAYVNSH